MAQPFQEQRLFHDALRPDPLMSPTLSPTLAPSYAASTLAMPQSFKTSDQSAQLPASLQGLITDTQAFVQAATETMKTMKAALKRDKHMGGAESGGDWGAYGSSAGGSIKPGEEPLVDDAIKGRKTHALPGSEEAPPSSMSPGQTITFDQARKQSGSSLRGLTQSVSKQLSSRYKNADVAPGSWGEKIFGETGSETGGVVGRVAGGESVLSSLGGLGGLADFAGPIGLGVGAAALGMHEMVSQRASNAQYQSIYGGSNFGTGFGNRAQSMLFGAQNAFGLGYGDSQKLFQGVSQTGLSGQGRQDALNFATTNYSQLGMSTQQSLALIQTVSKGAGQNLQDVATALTGLSQAAAQAGVNASTARDSFTSMYQGLVGAGQGPTAAAVAGGATKLISNMGRNMAGVTVDLSSESAISQMAAAQGMSISEYQTRAAESPGFAAQSKQKVIDTYLNSIGGGQIQKVVQQFKGQEVNGAFQNVNVGSGVGKAITAIPGANGLDLMSLMKSAGFNVKNESQAVQLVADLASGSPQASLRALTNQTQQQQKAAAKQREAAAHPGLFSQIIGGAEHAMSLPAELTGIPMLSHALGIPSSRQIFGDLKNDLMPKGSGGAASSASVAAKKKDAPVVTLKFSLHHSMKNVIDITAGHTDSRVGIIPDTATPMR